MSLYTRVVRVFAEELRVAHDLVEVPELDALEAEAYGGNPALKIPVMRDRDLVLFGAANVARAIAERAAEPVCVIWPETVTNVLARNAHELLAHAMTAQVQIAMGTIVSDLPPNNRFFVKARAGLDGSLRWLDGRLPAVLQHFPSRALSLFEVALFCLIEHLHVRPTLPAERYPTLLAFARRFGARPSAERTAYR